MNSKATPEAFTTFLKSLLALLSCVSINALRRNPTSKVSQAAGSDRGLKTSAYPHQLKRSCCWKVRFSGYNTNSHERYKDRFNEQVEGGELGLVTVWLTACRNASTYATGPFMRSCSSCRPRAHVSGGLSFASCSGSHTGDSDLPVSSQKISLRCSFLGFTQHASCNQLSSQYFPKY